jgi:predicted MFS family arabinose efflux permease
MSILGVVVGVVVATLLIGTVEIVGELVFLPEGADEAAIKAIMANPPLGGLLFVLSGWGVGTVCGAWLAVVIARRSPLYHALAVGLTLLAARVVDMIMLPRPLWFWVLGVAIFLLSTFVGCKLGQYFLRKAPAVEAPASPS